MSSERTFVFDKFMQDLESRQEDADRRRQILEKQEEEWEARRLLQRYREHPLNLRGPKRK